MVDKLFLNRLMLAKRHKNAHNTGFYSQTVSVGWTMFVLFCFVVRRMIVCSQQIVMKINFCQSGISACSHLCQF